MSDFLKMTDKGLIQFYYGDEIRNLTIQVNGRELVLPQHVEIDNTVSLLRTEHFIFTYEPEVFELPDAWMEKTNDAFKQYVGQTSYTNVKNLRLRYVTRESETFIFHTQPVFYETYLRTNMVMDFASKGGTSLREEIHQSGNLERFEESYLDNHLGINILMFTNTGELVLAERSSKVGYAPLQLAASISGGIAAMDVADGKSIDEQSVIREGIEELGLDNDDVNADSLKFLGLTRDLMRGGKPELFFAVNSKLSFDEIISKWHGAEDKWENNRLFSYAFGEDILHPIEDEAVFAWFNKSVNHLFATCGKSMSLPLETNLALWVKMKRNGH